MPSIVTGSDPRYHTNMERFGTTYLAFPEVSRHAWWSAALLGMLVLGSASICTAQSDAQAEERAADRAEERSEYLASRGFYRRQAAGHGWFLTRSDPEVERSRTLSDVLRTVPGVNILGGPGAARATSNRRVGACPLAVFVDGLYTTIRNVDELTLEDIEALEVYRGPSEVPLAYTAPTYEGTCGALLVWSRMEVSDD